MENYKKTIGNFGEDIAVKYLKKKGYKILEKNFNIRGGEIDIIAMDKSCIVFAEVKTRTNNSCGGGAEAVNYIKQQRLTKAAQVYLLNHKNSSARFDVLVVNCSTDGRYFKLEGVEHIENAF